MLHVQLQRKPKRESLAAGRMRIAGCCLFSCCFLWLCSAIDINCTVTQYPDQTIYTALEVSPVIDVKASDCVYTWADGSGIVIAHNKGKNPELVVRNTISTLITSKCFDKIVFACHPHSQREGYTAYCMINCTLNTPRFQEHNEISHNWIVGIAAAAAVTIIVVLGVMCYKFRDEISRMFSCGRLRRIYTCVNMQNVDPKEAEVEAGNV